MSSRGEREQVRAQLRALQAAQRQASAVGARLERKLSTLREPLMSERALQPWPAHLPADEELAHALLRALDQPEPRWDQALLKLAGLAALTGSLLDLALVGAPSAALASSVLGGLGAASEHLSSAPKVSFDKTLEASYGATGNHRWSSLSHHPTLVGLLSGIRDTLNSTSTHIVDAEVITVEASNQGVERALKNSPLSDPNAWAIEGVLWAAGRTLSHWWSDVNTSMGLPGPLSTLAKCVEWGSFEFEGHTFNLADYSYELYRAGLDMRRFLGDGLVPLSAQLVIRWSAWVSARGEGCGRGEALKRSLRLDERHQRALLLAYCLISGVNAAKVYLTANPLLLNISQWVALARLGARRFISAQLTDTSGREAKLNERCQREALELTASLQRLDKTQQRLAERLRSACGQSTRHNT